MLRPNLACTTSITKHLPEYSRWVCANRVHDAQELQKVYAPVTPLKAGNEGLWLAK
jgi:hypothetical protein